MLGRVSAVNSIFIGSSNELGAFESGSRRDSSGPSTVLLGGSAALAVVGMTARQVPRLHTLGRLPDRSAISAVFTDFAAHPAFFSVNPCFVRPIMAKLVATSCNLCSSAVHSSARAHDRPRHPFA
jgi:hypothetical protein